MNSFTRTGILTLVFTFSLSNLALAKTAQQIYQEGRNFLGDNGHAIDGARAIELFEKSAAMGFSQAQQTLGQIFTVGWESPKIERDFERGIKYLETCSEEGDFISSCMYHRGRAYLRKSVVTDSDQFEAFKWFKKSSDLNDELGMLAAAKAYLHGMGVKSNHEEAAKLFLRLAKHGNAEAQYYYGHMLSQGVGVQKNFTESRKWLEKAANQNNPEAQLQLGLLYLKGLDDTPQDTIKALSYLQQSAEGGNSTAAKILGGHFRVANNIKESFKWYEKSAELGDPESKTSLAEFYLYGDGVPKDETKAFKLLEEAAAGGDNEAKGQLARLRREGIGTAKDTLKANNEMLKAAHSGDMKAQYDLGLSYYYGDFQEKNKGQAFLWFEKSAMQGFDLAEQFAGEMLYYGDGVPMDKARGLIYYQKAASKGEPRAVEFLNKKGIEIPEYKNMFEAEKPAQDSALNTDRWGSL